MRRALLLLLMIAALPASAETIHRRVLPDGSIEFSDEPRPGSIPMEVPDLQTFEAQPLPPLTPPPRTAPPPAIASYQSLRITQPTEEQTLFFDAAGVGVNVAVAPGLQPGDRVIVYLDGQPVAAASSTSLTIPTPPRGTHRLSAEIQDASGQVVLRSAPVTFHLIQHSRLTR
ncbi:MAG: hypothetical protein AB7U81_03440 [Thiohalomonadaceae bacterium]